MVSTILCNERWLQTNARGAARLLPHDWTLSIMRVRHFFTVFAAQAAATYRWKSDSRSCPLNARRAKRSLVLKVTTLSHGTLLVPSHPGRSSHLCLTVLTTSSGAICLYLVSRERRVLKSHSLKAPTLLLRRDLFRLALSADQRNMFLDENQTKGGSRRNGETSVPE